MRPPLTSDQIYLPQIEKKLNAFLDKMSQEGIYFNAKMSRYHFETGGKRLRALIPMRIFFAYGKDPQLALPLGCALELIHNATLVHDDLQDGDVLRRGQPTVWKKFSEPQAVNCGDALFQFALLMLCGLKVKSDTLSQVVKQVTRGTLQVIEGQAQEFLMKEEASPGLDRYIEVVRGKTGALIATAVTSAIQALESDQYSPEINSAIEATAFDSGILFQIQDDLLDVYGEKGRGRRAADLSEGKISALIAVLNELATPTERASVREVLRVPRAQPHEKNIEEILELFAKYRVPEVLIQKIREIQNTAEKDARLKSVSSIQTILIDMNRQFLLPIQHLMA